MSNKITVRKVVDVTDPEYFCNKSWTLSFNMNTKSWISFHSYIPNWYIAENNFFYSGLNGGTDLEAIAVVEVPYVPTTTTTTTKCKTCKPATTTTTTTTAPDCTLEGFVTVLDCALEGIAYDITPTTTTSSTTSTTTTLCPCCNTYSIENPTTTTKTVTIITCTDQKVREVQIPVLPKSKVNACSCQDPIVPIESGVTFSIIASGCVTTFCYSVTLSPKTQQSAYIQWTRYDQTTVHSLFAPGESRCICAVQGTIYSDYEITIESENVPCTTNGYCVDYCSTTSTSSSTTTNYCP